MPSKSVEEVISFMEKRHSVRRYLDKVIEKEKRDILVSYVNKINLEYHTQFEVIFDEDEAFKSFLGRIAFKNVKNYIILFHKDATEAGYHSVPIILKLQELGLASCYVGATYKKSMYENDKSKTIQCAIAFGYGANEGKPHKNKPVEDILEPSNEKPPFLDYVVRAALSAPTAMNLQRFRLYVENNDVKVKLTKSGPFAEFDLGIVRAYVDLAKIAYGADEKK